MARTIRRNKTLDPREYHPSKRARKIEKRKGRQVERMALREYAR